MWVKICGNTRREDVESAAELGADAVGFVFAPGRRQVTAAQVARMSEGLPEDVERVGVFLSEDPDEIATAALQAGLTAVQVHGGFHERLLTRLAERLQDEIEIIQSLHWVVGSEATASALELQEEIRQVATLGVTDRILIDSKVGGASGGTGRVFDWEAAGQVFRLVPAGMRMIVAGGLNAGNVANAIAALRPWGVDVSSGVEDPSGLKDTVLIARFIQNARAATPR